VVNAHIVIEAAASKRSSCRITAGRGLPGSSCRRQRSSSRRVPCGATVGDGVDEILVLGGVAAAGHGQGLPVRLGLESRRAHVGQPDLDRARTTPMQALAMRSHLARAGADRLEAAMLNSEGGDL
jgi:hypothetical protein